MLKPIQGFEGFEVVGVDFLSHMNRLTYSTTLFTSIKYVNELVGL